MANLKPSALKRAAFMPKPTGNDLKTIRQSLLWATNALSGFENPAYEAQWLLTHVLGLKTHELVLNASIPLSNRQKKTFFEFIEKRLQHEPAQYITGTAFFMGLEFKVTRDTLIPRPETETLAIEAISALKAIKGRVASPVALDLCTGSGCVAIAIASVFKDILVYATDASARALNTARKNAVAHNAGDRVRFVKGDLYEPVKRLNLKGKISLIVSNPPYIAKKDLAGLAPEIRNFEPKKALCGGIDGLDFYRRIIPQAPDYLSRGGYLLLEMGYDQAAAVKKIALKTGAFEDMEAIKDLSGIKRVFKARHIVHTP